MLESKNPSSLIKKSIHLSYLLRHKPDSIGLTPQGDGWFFIDELLLKNSGHKHAFTREELFFIVATDDKSRYSLSDDLTMIRAAQGHSSPLTIVKQRVATPPSTLYHGTARDNLESILREGINKGNRHHVHLSDTQDLAITVGARHGKPIVFAIDAISMTRDGYIFNIADNGVWLIDYVPSRYITMLPG